MLDIGCCLPAIALAQARRAGMLDEKQKTTEAFFYLYVYPLAQTWL